VALVVRRPRRPAYGPGPGVLGPYAGPRRIDRPGHLGPGQGRPDRPAAAGRRLRRPGRGRRVLRRIGPPWGRRIRTGPRPATPATTRPVVPSAVPSATLGSRQSSERP